jgi:hypothetical protein
MPAHRLRLRGGPTGSRSHARAEEPGQSAHQPSARTGNSSARSGAFGRPARRQPLDTLRTPPSEAASPAFKPNAARGCAQPVPLGVLARPVAPFLSCRGWDSEGGRRGRDHNARGAPSTGRREQPSARRVAHERRAPSDAARTPSRSPEDTPMCPQTQFPRQIREEGVRSGHAWDTPSERPQALRVRQIWRLDALSGAFPLGVLDRASACSRLFRRAEAGTPKREPRWSRI